MGENPEPASADRTRPVEQVSWNDVQAFLTRIAERWSPVSGSRFRPRNTGNMRAGPEPRRAVRRTAGSDIAWYYENSGGETHPVGQKRAQRLGSCTTCWATSGSGARTSTGGTASGERDASADRVLRGGSWHSSARDVRAACRGRVRPGLPGRRHSASAVPSSAVPVQQAGWSERRVSRSGGRSPAETTSRRAEPGGWTWRGATRTRRHFLRSSRSASSPTSTS